MVKRGYSPIPDLESEPVRAGRGLEGIFCSTVQAEFFFGDSEVNDVDLPSDGGLRDVEARGGSENLAGEPETVESLNCTLVSVHFRNVAHGEL